MVAQREAVSRGLLLGDGERLLDLDLATVGDDHVLQGLVPAVCLGALHLPHHILPGTRDGRAGQGNLLGMRVSGWAAARRPQMAYKHGKAKPDVMRGGLQGGATSFNGASWLGTEEGRRWKALGPPWRCGDRRLGLISVAQVLLQTGGIQGVPLPQGSCPVLEQTTQVGRQLQPLTMPSRTLPNTTCLPSSQAVLTVVMKNWEPLVSLPALAMLTQPGP